jgi:uncharacterized protein (TIGR00369 family)
VTTVPAGPSPHAAWLYAMPVFRHLCMSVVEIGDGAAVLAVELAPETAYAPGAGFPACVVGALIDFCGGAAAVSALPPGARAATSDYTVKMLGPAAGPRLVAYGRCLNPGARTSVSEVQVHDRDQSGPTRAVGLVTMRALLPSAPVP